MSAPATRIEGKPVVWMTDTPRSALWELFNAHGVVHASRKVVPNLTFNGGIGLAARVVAKHRFLAGSAAA